MASRSFIPEWGELFRRQEEDAGAGLPLDLQPMERHVPAAGVRVVAHDEPEGDEGAGVEVTGHVGGQLEEVVRRGAAVALVGGRIYDAHIAEIARVSRVPVVVTIGDCELALG